LGDTRKRRRVLAVKYYKSFFEIQWRERERGGDLAVFLLMDPGHIHLCKHNIKKNRWVP
jgi:hypothetical protein